MVKKLKVQIEIDAECFDIKCLEQILKDRFYSATNPYTIKVEEITNWLAVDKNGIPHLYRTKPYRDGEHMTQTDKDLLLQDLCSRLPYGVKVNINEKIETLNVIGDDDGYYFNFLNDNEEGVTIENIKPYLFPLSSMTMDQAQQWHKYANDRGGLASSTDWLNAHHFDYRGLIDKGLAIDASNLNIY